MPATPLRALSLAASTLLSSFCWESPLARSRLCRVLFNESSAATIATEAESLLAWARFNTAWVTAVPITSAPAVTVIMVGVLFMLLGLNLNDCFERFSFWGIINIWIASETQTGCLRQHIAIAKRCR